MSKSSSTDESGLEVFSPDRSRRFIRISESPFLIGRGQTGKHLGLTDPRISRQCAAIVNDSGTHYLEDRGQRHGIFVNGKRITRHALKEGDVVTFGFENFYRLIFHSPTFDSSITNILAAMENFSSSEGSSRGLHKLNLLLEATALLHSHLPLDSVLATMLDHALAVTDADRGILLEPDPAGALCVRLARRSGGGDLGESEVIFSKTALRLALDRQSSVLTEDLAQADFSLQGAASIIAQHIRAVVVVPLYAMARASTAESAIHGKRGEFLGAIYLDSRRLAAFSKLDRRLLDALANEAASILDNARLVERDRQRQRLEHEIGIARDIQQALLPRGSREFSHITASGINLPCLTVGGDYFDVFPMSEDRIAFLIADVSGKGIGAALLATMLQGALFGMTIGADPARVFNQINRFLCEHPEVGRYATVFFGIIDQDGQLEFINAGHPSPFLLRSDLVSEPFFAGSCPVGLFPETEYTVARTKLEPGDTIVLFSDGVTEAVDPDEEMFGGVRLRQVLGGQCQCSLDDLQKTILGSVETFARGADQSDDITVFLLRYRALAAQVMGKGTVDSGARDEGTPAASFGII
jgi:phosphoserine phosphatase RsbU/P